MAVRYLAQHQDITRERTIYEEVLDAKQDIVDMERERWRPMAVR